MYKVLVAELAGHRGRLDVSIENYLDVARATLAPEIVERAVRIAVYGRNDQAALEATHLWLKLDPDNSEAHRVLLALYLRLGDMDKAVQALEDLVSHWNGPADEAYATAVDLLARERDDDKASEVMERFMRTHAEDRAARFAQARLAARQEDLELASRLLPSVIQEDPKNRQAVILYARVLQAQGKTEQSIDYMRQLVRSEPDNVEVRVEYARMLVNAKRYDDALKQFREVSRIAPKNAEVRLALALLLLQTDRTDEAAKEFETLIVMRKRTLTAHYYLGQIAEAQKKLPLALEHYRRVDRGQHRLDSNVRIAVILALQGKVEEARNFLHSVQTADDQEASRLYLVETELLTEAKQYQAAMQVFDSAIKEYPENSDLIYARAMLAEKMDRLDILERDLRTIINREPKNAQALNALGYTLADRTDRYDEALAYIGKALALKPDDYYILDSMGWVLYRMGRQDEALKYLRRAAELSDDVEIAAHLGEVLWVSGNQQQARKVWDAALKTTPDDRHLQEVIKRFLR